MQRIVFCLVLFSFCMLSFSASCMMFLKNESQTVFNVTNQLSAEQELEKEEEVRDVQVLIPGRFVFGLIGNKLIHFEYLNLKLTSNFKLIHTPPPRD